MLIPYIQQGQKANIVVIRKVGNTIRDSVYSKILWAIDKFNLSNSFKRTVNPFKITHIKTGTSFYFYGQDDFEKLKSNDIGNLIAVWYEEASEFKNEEEFTQTNITFMRQKHELAPFVQFFWSYNPPRNPYSWINKWSEKNKQRADYLVHHSTYKDDKLGFTTEQTLADMAETKANDFDYYRFIYLGEAVGVGNNIYNFELFKQVEGLQDEQERFIALFFSTDTGYSVSATTTLALALTNKRNVYLLDTAYYSPIGRTNKRSAEQHSKAIREFEQRIVKQYQLPIVSRVVDSADGAIRNQYFNMYGTHLEPVHKGTKLEMIEYCQDLLAQGRMYVIKNEGNEIFLDEHQKYMWEERTLESNPDNPSVIKVDDHTCDAFQYFVKMNLKTLGLKY